MHSTRSKGFIMIVIFAMMMVLLAACGGNNSMNNNQGKSGNDTPAEELVLTDATGHEVKIPANPQRIIASYLEDYLVALDVKPVAQWSVSNGIQDYLQGTLEGIPTIPYDLPFEVVASFEPDFILVGDVATVEGGKYDQYSKIAPTYVLGDDVIKDWRKTLLKIGEILQKEDRAQQLLDEYEKKAAEAQVQIQDAIGDESVAAIWLVAKQFYIVSDNLSSGSVLYQDMGLPAPDTVKKISASGTGNWNAISLEELASMDVDHLFLINSDIGEGASIIDEPIWQGIPAVKNGHVYEFPSTSSWLYGGLIANSQIIDDVVSSVVK